MGVESAVYQFHPRSGSSTRAREMLTKLGAEEIDSRHLVLRGADYWIDVQVGVPEPLVSLRVAVCNPDGVFRALRQTIEALFEVNDGELIDLEDDRRLESLDDEAWLRLRGGFERKQVEFRSHFGDFTAAISADRVFDELPPGNSER